VGTIYGVDIMLLSKAEFAVLYKLRRYGDAPEKIIKDSFRNTNLDSRVHTAMLSLLANYYIKKEHNSTLAIVSLMPKGKDTIMDALAGFIGYPSIDAGYLTYIRFTEGKDKAPPCTSKIINPCMEIPLSQPFPAETFLVQNAVTGKAFGTPFYNEAKALEHAKAMAGAYNTVTQVVKLIKTVKYIQPVTTEGSFEVK
jgi:hypothetical protein